MVRANEKVEAVLREYADLVAIGGRDAFRARAYEKAARAIGGHPTDVSRLDDAGLRGIPGVGASIADKVAEYLRTGRLAALDRARQDVPPGVRELMSIPNLGPKKALTLHRELRVGSVDELVEAIEGRRLRGLKGFGPRTEEKILRGIELMRASSGRTKLGSAMGLAEDAVAALSEVPGVDACAFAGSLRRMRETVGDIDLLAAAEDPGPLMEAFTGLPGTAEVVARGEKKTTVRTADGLQMDLRVLPAASWGAGLVYFTGSQAHNIRLRERAQRRGLKLSEYGLDRGRKGGGRRIAAATEEEVYAGLGLPWIPPVLREDRGEIEAAERDELPRLVTEDDVRGDLHTHTDLTDGVSSLEDMIDAAAARGYRYYAVTDHAPDLVMQRMTDDKALAQRERLRALQERHRGMRLLHGTELNIDPEGNVDWPEEFLAGFDVCVASVHSHFELGREAQTRRLVRTCENPRVNIIGHPTTRRIGRRQGIDVDLDEVFSACARTGTALEINSHPDRLDLNDALVLRAKRHGVRFAIDSDAHAAAHLGHLRYGVGTAQRGWLTPDDVINAWPLGRLRAFLRKRRGGGS